MKAYIWQKKTLYPSTGSLYGMKRNGGLEYPLSPNNMLVPKNPDSNFFPIALPLKIEESWQDPGLVPHTLKNLYPASHIA